MIIWGAVLAICALLLIWRTSRYDLKGAAWESAWQVARGRRSPETPTTLEVKVKEITDEKSATGKATRAAGTIAGHFMAQAAGLVGILMLLAGIVLVIVGYFVG